MKLMRVVLMAVAMMFIGAAYAQGNRPYVDDYLEKHASNPNSALAGIAKIMGEQESWLYRMSETGTTTAIALNGRPLALTSDDFWQVVVNTLLECNAAADYLGKQKKRIGKACEDYVVDGVKDWAAVSRDKSISEKAWFCGAQYAVFGSPNPDRMTINFGHWAGMARVCQGKMSRGR